MPFVVSTSPAALEHHGWYAADIMKIQLRVPPPQTTFSPLLVYVTMYVHYRVKVVILLLINVACTLANLPSRKRDWSPKHYTRYYMGAHCGAFSRQPMKYFRLSKYFVELSASRWSTANK